MKHIVTCLAAVLTIAPFASGAPICLAGTLATYEALGSGGCMIGTNTLFSFSNPSGISGATLISPGSIQIAPSGGTTAPVLTFTFSATAANGVLLETLIDYSMSGNRYTSDSITLTGSSSSGNGAVTDIQNYCLGGSFDSSGVRNCSTFNAGNLLVFGNGSNSATFAATSFLNITHDLTFDSGGRGAGNTAAGGTVTDAFVATPVVPATPEPATYLLVLAGLGLVVLPKTVKMSKKGKEQIYD